MSLQNNILGEDERDELDALFKSIFDYEPKKLRLYIRKCFAEFIYPLRPDIETHTLTRVLEKPSSRRDQSLTAAAYDFAIDRLPGLIEKTGYVDDETRKDMLSIIDGLKNKQKIRLSGSQSFGADVDVYLDLGGYTQPISRGLLGNYFGYRRSANLDQIIRFNIKILQVPGKNRVTFVNEYMRGQTHWRVTGVGYSIKNTLYLYGHALDAHDRSDKESPAESLGLRFFALRSLDETNCLHGLVMSMTDDTPIAARIVLIRMDEHHLTPELSALKRDNREAWERKMIEESPEFYHEIESQIGNMFWPRKREYFLELIRNSNSSVLKARVQDNTTIAIKEQMIRHKGSIIGADLSHIIQNGYEKLLDDTIARLETISPG